MEAVERELPGSTLKLSIVSGVILALLSIDYIFDKRFMQSSSEYSYWFQTSGGSFLWGVSVFFSTVGIAWYPLLLHFYIVLSTHVLHTMYILTISLIPLTIVFTLKAIYYRGRPFVINQQVIGCACDPGWPSGHAATAVVAFWGLYKIIDFHYMSRGYRSDFKPRIPLAIVCILLGFCVIISRLILGVHTYSQLFAGALISAWVIYEIDYDYFTVAIRKLAKYIKPISLVCLVVFPLFTFFMLYINHTYREKPEYWQHWDTCPSCMGTFVRGQTASLSLIMFLPAYYFFYPLHLDKKRPTFIRPKPRAGYKRTRVAAYFMFLVCHGMAVIIYLPIYLFPVDGVIEKAAFEYIWQALINVYLGFLWGRGKSIIVETVAEAPSAEQEIYVSEQSERSREMRRVFIDDSN